MTQVPAVDRAVAILNLLASNSEHGFRSKEIADTLTLNPPTCLSILRELTTAGFLTRDEPTKTYRLGPRIAAIGLVAQSRYPGYQVASTELRALTKRFNVESLAAAAVGQDIEVIDRVLPPAMWRSSGIEPRSPLALPYGLVYKSWLPAGAFDDWIRANGRTSENDLALYRSAAAIVRKRGYAGGFDTSPDQLLEITNYLNEVGEVEQRRETAMELLALLRHGMNFITAPVFGPSGDGTVPLALTVFRPDRAIERLDERALIQTLRNAADRVTKAIGGVRPSTVER